MLADRQRLKQVLLNLLSNAVKYNRAGGSVTVACDAARTRPAAASRCSDTGPGIPAEQLDRLFTPFERLGAERPRSRAPASAWRCRKRLVEAMGGELGVESTPGAGQHVLGRAAAARSAASSRAADERRCLACQLATYRRRRRTVLYIEDNLANLELVERSCCRTGRAITLLPAMQGQLGLELAREHRPDLILLDLHLPDIQGDEVLRRCRPTPAHARHPGGGAQRRRHASGRSSGCWPPGARAYLTKPLDVRRLPGSWSTRLLARREATA